MQNMQRNCNNHNPTRLLSCEEGIDLLHEGAVIAYPTEAVYGLGCDPEHLDALRKLIVIKQRAPSKGFIIIFSSVDQIENYLNWEKISAEQWEQVLSTWPGPVTWVVPASQHVSPLILGPNHTIAVRLTNHAIARTLCQGLGKPIVSTSANSANQKAATQVSEMEPDILDNIAGIVAGPLGEASTPSWVIDFTNKTILRRGPDAWAHLITPLMTEREESI